MQIKKEIKTKDKRVAKTPLGGVQTDNKSEVWECVLYLRGKRIELLKLAHWASAGKGISWSISKIRPENTATTMLQLQYKFRGEWGNFYREYAKKRWQPVRGRDINGQIENSKSIRLVRATLSRI